MFRLERWVLRGLVLDVAALAALWGAVNALGKIEAVAQNWLDALCFVAVPWLVHVLVLPALFDLPRPTALRCCYATATYIAVSAIAIPTLGLGFFYLLLLLFVATSPLWWYLFPDAQGFSPAWVAWVSDLMRASVILSIATPVGAVLGYVMAALRQSEISPSPPRPLVRGKSDALGGAIAAFLAFAGAYVASYLGIFTVTRPATFAYPPLVAPPRLLATLVIGAIAYFPHLFLTGRDIRNAPSPPPELRSK